MLADGLGRDRSVVLLVDTGPLVALGDTAGRSRSSPLPLNCWKATPARWSRPGAGVAGWPYSAPISRGLGVVAELALIAMIRDGSLKVEALYQADWDRVDQLVGTYADLGLWRHRCEPLNRDRRTPQRDSVSRRRLTAAISAVVRPHSLRRIRTRPGRELSWVRKVSCHIRATTEQENGHHRATQGRTRWHR